MTADSVLIKAQAAALRLMVDTCLIQRPAAVASNPETGYTTTTYTTIYSGVCRVQQRTVLARQFTVGEATVYMSRLELHVPVTITGILADDIISITASVHDQDLIGRKWHVSELGHKTYESARRFAMVEILS